jgi:hypothetical protein
MADELIGGASGGDTGAETASPAPADVTPVASASEASPAARVDAPAGGDLDDEDEDVYDEERLVQDRAALRNLIRNRRRDGKFAKENRTLVRRIRDAGLDLDDLIVTQRNHQSLMARLEAEPELLQRIVTAPGRPAEQARQAPVQRPQYTPPAIPPPPFASDDEAGKWMHDSHQMVLALHRELHELKQNYGHGLHDVLQWRKGIETDRQRQQSQQRVQTWKSAISEFGKDYDEDGQALLEREVVGLFEWAQKNNRQDVLAAPKTFIPKLLEKYGKPLQRFRKQQQQAAAALVQQASAAAATRGARPAAFTGGIPAGARSPKRETVKDVTRRLLRGA